METEKREMDVFEFSNFVIQRAFEFVKLCKDSQKTPFGNFPEELSESDWWERFLEYLDLHEIDMDFNSEVREGDG